MKMKSVLLVAFMLAVPAFAAELQLDSFDDISGWSGGLLIQGGEGDSIEGTGCLIADYTPYGSDNYYLNKTVSLDLFYEAAAPGAAISLWMWVGKDALTARLDTLTFETSYGNNFVYDPTPWNYTLPTGWNQLVIPLSDFAVTGVADWSNITNIKIATTCYDDTTPTDVMFDDLRIVFESKCNVMDLNDDCEFDLADLAIMAGCWLVDCSADADNSCCDWR